MKNVKINKLAKECNTNSNKVLVAKIRWAKYMSKTASQHKNDELTWSHYFCLHCVNLFNIPYSTELGNVVNGHYSFEKAFNLN